MSVVSGRRRQGLVVAGVAGMAVAAGVGWQSLRAPAAPAGPPWDQRFPTPDGAELDMASMYGRPLVLNFWATWCPPASRNCPNSTAFTANGRPKGGAWWGWRWTAPSRCASSFRSNL